MLKFFTNNKHSLEELVNTYKEIMLNDLGIIERGEKYSRAEKDIIESERKLSFQVLDALLKSADKRSK